MNEARMHKAVFAARLDNLETMLDFIEQSVKEVGFDAKKSNEVRLASEEVLVNVINYAYPDKQGNIEIACTADDKRLLLEIVDWGIPFNPLLLLEPDIKSPMEKRKIGGLGIYMVRSIMDRVDYRRDEDKNILTLTKI
jgi:anti-sigma regulatory factor (Ser/Thr protein kinase)